MNPAKVIRERVKALTDLPNIGPAMAADLRLLGIDTPTQLLGRDPYAMYDDLCTRTHTRHDPCVLDVFLSITRFMAGDAPQPWWHYTAERKAADHAGRIPAPRLGLP
ncbi:MAG: helix-hairpin-helix domain-containing protein [Uliginosibacterium sp.]|nr:helix-hairpin-helix domain-containing protein [Uliginosibacterium sp.]